MKHAVLSTASALLCSLPLAAAAADFVRHSDNQPQSVSRDAGIQVVNFWATWCTPCRKEMPELSRWYSKKGKPQHIRMTGIALDKAENVAAFLRQTPVSYPIWRYDGKNSRAMMKTFGSNSGALPYTVVLDAACNAQTAITGTVDGAKLDAAVAQIREQCKKS